jgi:FAD binding domain
MFIVEHNRNLSVLLDTFPTLREGVSFQDLVDIFPVGLRSHLLLGVVRSFLLFVFVHSSFTISLSYFRCCSFCFCFCFVQPLQYRFYSISSSHKVSPDTISIDAARVQWRTPCGPIHYGVASNFLNRLRTVRISYYSSSSLFELSTFSL